MFIDGIEIVKSSILEPLPTLKLKDSIQVTEEFRASFNQWLLDTFGTKEQAVMWYGKAYVSADTYEKLITHGSK